MFSEYIEGSSDNKAWELFNSGTVPIDLTKCIVNRYVNGSATAAAGPTPFAAGAVLAPGAVYSVCGNTAVASLLAKCTQTDTHMTYNGNDALELVCNGTTYDVIGQIGVDPGTAGWGTAPTTTTDATLVRKCTVLTGDKIGTDAFNPATEWNGHAIDTFTLLGSRACPYAHTITIDGTNDFTTVETFATTSSAYTGYVTWDATSLFVGMAGPDVGANDPNKWVLLYLGGTPNTTTSALYNSQQASLPFGAHYHMRWKTDNLYTNAQLYNGTAWVDALWNFTGNVHQNGTYVEFRIPLTSLGSPTSISMAMLMVNEASGIEWSYAGVPSTLFTDGYDPNYAKYFTFDLASPKVPGAATPLP
jgi:hypothetical protein